MRSFLVAVLFSIIILITSFLFSNHIEKISRELTDKNKIVIEYLRDEDMEKATAALDETQEKFKKYKVILEATSDHEELLRIELELASAREFITGNQLGDALAACSEIDLLLEHLPGNFKLKTENIL